MDRVIFESLENLEVSEECFSDIMRIVEALLEDASLSDEKAHWGSIGRHYKKENKKLEKESKPIRKEEVKSDNASRNAYKELADSSKKAVVISKLKGFLSPEAKQARATVINNRNKVMNLTKNHSNALKKVLDYNDKMKSNSEKFINARTNHFKAVSKLRHQEK